MDDRKLARLVIRRRDEAAFRLLYQKHTSSLYALVLRLLGGRESEAQDLIQETWIRACRKLPGFRWESSLRTWLTSIALNLVREAVRRRGRETAAESQSALSETAEPISRPFDRMDLERAIAGLPDGYRQVLVLCDVEGYTHEETGRLLGIAPGTSKSQLFHARRAMRTLLNDRGRHHEQEH
jgi:RNA polymerase sigma-70 factor (ECF subfamily)